MIKHFVLLLALVGVTVVTLPAADTDKAETESDPRAGEFVYVVDADRGPRPRYRKVEQGLPGGLPRDELLSDVDPAAQSTWKFGWFAYGEGNSRSIGVGLRGNDDPQLFVDSNRDKCFRDDERVSRDEKDPGRWRLPMDAEFLTPDNDYVHVPRSILIRPSRSGFLEIATEGVMEGHVEVGGKLVAARRLDRDSNGRWFDSTDRILLDSNGDGKIDPIGGRISCESICRVGGKRFVLQSDMQGEWLELVELTGVGTIVPQLDLQPADAVIKELSGAFVSQAGVRAAIRAVDRPIECPVGDYRIESLSVEVAYQDVTYWFRFSNNDAEHRYSVALGQSVDVDLLGSVTLSSTQTTVKVPGGATLKITPLLTTSSGMYLSGCKTGRIDPTLENRLLTESRFENRVIDNNSTGFS